MKTKEEFGKISNNLDVNSNLLLKTIIMKTRIIGNQVIESPLLLKECYFARDSLSKALYDFLFNWLIKKMNNTFEVENSNETNIETIYLGFEINLIIC